MAEEEAKFQVGNGESLVPLDIPDTDPYEKKYFALLRRCEQIQQSNEKLVNRIHHVKKLLRRLRHERRFLMRKLDQLGDDYKNVPMAIPTEDNPISFDCLPPPPPYPGPPKAQMSSLATPSNPDSNSESPGPSSSLASTSKKKARTEKDKNPSVSKKPLNPFFLFCQDQNTDDLEQFMDESKKEIGDQDLSKNLVKNWNSLSAEEKKIYYDMYEKEKECYDQELKVFSKKTPSTDNSSISQDDPTIGGVT